MTLARLRSTPQGQPDLMQLQRELQRLDDRLTALVREPRFEGPIDMQGNSITNVGRSQQSHDVMPRAELEDEAMVKDSSGNHVAKSGIIATSGIRSTRQARERNELVPLGQLLSLVSVESGDNGAKFLVVDTTTSVLPTIGGGVENFAATSSFIHVTGPTAPFSIGSIQGGNTSSRGRMLILFNYTSQTMTLKHLSVTATVIANRILCPNGNDVVVFPSAAAWLLYNIYIPSWVLVSSI